MIKMRHRYNKMDNTMSISFLVLLVAVPAWSDAPSWSQQLSSFTSELGDWVPLSNSYASDRSDNQLLKRQTYAQPRVLNEPVLYRPTNYQDSLTSSGFFQTQGGQSQLYLQTVPSAPQNYLTDQTGFGQSFRLPLGQPQTFPLTEGFAQYNFDQSVNSVPARPDLNQRFQQKIHQSPSLATPTRFETYQKQIPQNTLELKATVNPQSPKSYRPEIPKFIDGYKLDNASNEYFSQSIQKKPQSLQKLKLESTTKAEVTQNLNQRKIVERYPEIPLVKPPSSNIEREEVQLLYVPVEALNRGQFNLQQSTPNAHVLNRDIYNPSAVRPDSLNQAYMPVLTRLTSRPHSTYQQNFIQHAINEQNFQANSAQAIHAQKLQENSAQAINQQNLQQQAAQSSTKYQATAPSFSPTPPSSAIPPPSSPKQKKLKPHQPPLAVFMVHDLNKGESVKVSDVLSTLNNIRSVPVLDSVSPTSSPRVFIGPSILKSPENYAKFELPYLSNIENSEKRLRQLPFFVAPLSYKTPDGFAKIPFPSPHVGSVIVNAQMEDTFAPSSTPVADVFPNAYTPSSSVNLPTEIFKSSFQTEVPPRPTFSYFSTVTGNNNLHTSESPFGSNIYSFEPQPVAPFKPLAANNEPSIITAPPGSISSYFSPPQGNIQEQYVNFPFPHGVTRNIQYQSSTPNSLPTSNEYQIQKGHYITKLKPESTTTPLTTTTTTTSKTTITETTTPKAPSTLPNSLIETHNPFSINQAFEYSSPFNSQYQTTISQSNNELISKDYSPTPKIEPQISEIPQKVLSDYNLPQSYVPDIEYKPEIIDTHFSSFDGPSQYISTTTTTEGTPKKFNYERQNEQLYAQSYPQTYQQNNPQISANFEPEYIQTTRSSEIHQPDYFTSKPTPSTTTTQRPSTSTTTKASTTRRTLSSRGRPRYTTSKPATDQGDISTKAPITRRPVPKRRPLPPIAKYEPSKIQEISSVKQSTTDYKTTTERYVKSTTKILRTRNRGRLQPKTTSIEKEIPKEQSEEYGNKKQKTKSSYEKNNSLAYQRDVLHQNYPVTLMERMSTVDIEDTTPYSQNSTYKFVSRNTPSSTETFNKFEETTQGTQSMLGIYENAPNFEEDLPKYITKTDISYDGETYPSISISTEKYNSYDRPTESEAILASEEFAAPTSDIERDSDSITVRYKSAESTEDKNEDEQNVSKNKNSIQNSSQSSTLPTPTAFKARKRQRQPSTTRYESSVPTESSVSTEATRKITAGEYRRMSGFLPVTYRPAFDRRRTTMRIEEIEADLKTKEVHMRHDYKEDSAKHPIYKPESSIEPGPTTIASETSTAKRISQFRRRRPSISSTSTTVTPSSSIQNQSRENTQNKRNRFTSRGRSSTTAIPLENQERETDASNAEPMRATIQRPTNTNRFSTRTRVPYEKFSRPTTTERVTESDRDEYEDQAPLASINRPQFIAFDDSKSLESSWSPKLSSNSFKPINPNMISLEEKSNSDKYGNKVGSRSTDVVDIITVDNQFEDVLIAVTPASNKLNRKFPAIIPASSEVYIKQNQKKQKETDAIETFESVLEEVMKNLEEQDEDEYNVDYTRNVKKHERGEIGEIPPEKVISSGVDSVNRGISYRNEKEMDVKITPITTKEEFTIFETSPATQSVPEKDRKERRRGVWKRVNVRPVTEEPIEYAESQYYTNTANTLLPETTTKVVESDIVRNNRNELVIPLSNTDELGKNENDKVQVQTDGGIEESTSAFPETFYSTFPEFTTESDINKIDVATTTLPSLEEYLVNNQFEAKNTDKDNLTEAHNNKLVLNTDVKSKLPKNPGDMDLGTGAPDISLMEFIYRADKEAANLTPAEIDVSILDNSKDVNGVMDFLLGVTATENMNSFTVKPTDSPMEIMDAESNNMKPTTVLFPSTEEVDFKTERSVVTEISQNKVVTSTEELFIPDEMATTAKPKAERSKGNDNEINNNDETSTTITQTVNVQGANKIPQNEIVGTTVEEDSKPSSTDPWNLSNAHVSMSMSTEISEETEICFRGKCIKTKKDNL